MPMRGPLLLVLAATRRDFERWCLDSGLSRDDPEVVYADREAKLRGVIHIKVIRCRGWWEHPDADLIGRLADTIEQKDRRT